MGAAILALLVVMPNEHWIMAAFKLSPSPEAERLIGPRLTDLVPGSVVVGEEAVSAERTHHHREEQLSRLPCEES
jgi:hypothetical protein